MADKLKNLTVKKRWPACCDFSKDNTAKESLLETIKKEVFASDRAMKLTDDELKLVNAAAKLKPSPRRQTIVRGKEQT